MKTLLTIATQLINKFKMKKKSEIKKKTPTKPKFKEGFEKLTDKALMAVARKVAVCMTNSDNFRHLEPERNNMELHLHCFEYAYNQKKYENTLVNKKLANTYRYYLLCHLYSIHFFVKLKADSCADGEGIMKSAGFKGE